jgi:Na+/H+-translocating membrane pyrophosphatase
VALAALGMLGTLSSCLTIDVYGPISDNAGGIAEMAGLDEYVRTRPDLATFVISYEMLNHGRALALDVVSSLVLGGHLLLLFLFKWSMRDRLN